MMEQKKGNYFGEPKDIKRNIILYFFDGMTFMPSLALISITTVIPFFLETLQASTFQFAMATSVTTIGMLVGKPFFGSMASRATLMAKTFAKVLFTQRLTLLLFVLIMPLLAPHAGLMIWMFIVFWAIFNLLAGSYMVFNVPLILKLLPPHKRAGMRGVGQGIGNIIGLGMAGLIPVVLESFSYPYNFMVLFGLGLLFLFLNATGFWLMKEHEDVEPRIAMKLHEYIKAIPASLKEDATFRAMVLFCMFLLIGVSLIPFYTLYGIRMFTMGAEQIALLATLAILSAIGVNLTFGFIIDRFGPVKVSPVTAVFIIISGLILLMTGNIHSFYVAWVLINIANFCYMKATNLMLGDVSPPGKSPLYVGVLFMISMALSSVVVLLLAPLMELAGFTILFVMVVVCGALGLFYNLFVFQKRLRLRR